MLSNINPAWYYKRPGGGPQYDITVYALHNLTGIMGPAKRVMAMSGLVVPEREFKGETITCEMDDNTLMLLDYGSNVFAFVYGTVTGGVLMGFTPAVFGTANALKDGKLGEESLMKEGDHEPHVVGVHAEMGENHVFEDMMQLVDMIRLGTDTLATPEHARHVIDIIESGYRSAESGKVEKLSTTFEALRLDEIAEMGD